MSGKDVAQILQRIGGGAQAGRRAETPPAIRWWPLQLGHNQPPNGGGSPGGHCKREGHLINACGSIEGQVQVLAIVHATQLEAARLEIVQALKNSIRLGGLLHHELLKIYSQLLHIAAEGLDRVGIQIAGYCARILDYSALLTRRSSHL